MGKKDFSDLEDQIRDTVRNAFNAIDFVGLKKDIGSKAESTFSEVKANLKKKSYHYNEKMKNKGLNQYKNVTYITKRYENKVQMYIKKRPVGSISGIVYTVLGAILSGALGILLIIDSIFLSFFSTFSISSGIGLGILFSFFATSIALTLRGVHLRKRVKRFKTYVSLLNGHSYCSIQELASAIRRKNKFVIKDLRKMIDLGMFLEGHIDDKQTCFMLNDEVYEDYLNSQKAFNERTEDELKRQEELNREKNDPEKKELRYTIEEGERYIAQIKSVSDVISAEEISAKLHRLQNIVSQILRYVGNNPKKLPEVNKFTNHYLPITLKLVNSYKELNDQPVQGENIKNAKNEIEKSIDIINTAFEKLLDDLFEEIALDISTDISVLETLFTQEGLTKNDFKK